MLHQFAAMSLAIKQHEPDKRAVWLAWQALISLSRWLLPA